MNVRSLILFFVLALTVGHATAQNTFPALLADGPFPALKETLQTFGQLVGSWTFEGVEYHDDGSRATDKGEIHFQWVLQGRAIEDVWLETSRSDNDPMIYGTNIRFYDPKTDTWKVTWMDPVTGSVQPLIGHARGPEIVMEGSNRNGAPIHWIFSEITSTSFRWHAEKLVGRDWHTYEDITVHRK